MYAHRQLAQRYFAVVLVMGLAFASVPSIGYTQSFNSDVIVTTTDTPAVSLRQTGGLGVRNWRLAANESLFFIHDETGGVFPFTIIATAPTDSLVIGDNGTVGLGTLTPKGNAVSGRGSLHVFGNPTDDAFSGIGPDPNAGPAFNFGYSGASFGRSSGFFNVRPDALATSPNPSLRFATGNTQRMIIANNGNVGIGDGPFTPAHRLHVVGNIHATGNITSDGTTVVPDYVFAPDYQLMPLKQLSKFIEKERHLPEIPSAKEIQQNGVNLTVMQMQLLKKVEELTLYTLEQEQTANLQQRKTRTQDKTIAQLRATVARLTNTLNDVTARLTVLEQSQKR